LLSIQRPSKQPDSVPNTVMTNITCNAHRVGGAGDPVCIDGYVLLLFDNMSVCM